MSQVTLVKVEHLEMDVFRLTDTKITGDIDPTDSVITLDCGVELLPTMAGILEIDRLPKLQSIWSAEFKEEFNDFVVEEWLPGK